MLALAFQMSYASYVYAQSPTITSPATANAAENQTFAIDVESTDDINSEGFGLTYTLTGGLDVALFGVDASTGVITFNTAPDFEVPGDNGGDNVYDVQVTVTDQVPLTDVQDIAITVTNVNEAPSIVSASGVSVAENLTFAVNVQSSDPDGETESGGGLTYSLTGGADQALFNIDVNDGSLTFASAPDFETPLDAGTDNIYNVQVTVTDVGLLTGFQDITVTVLDVNEAPTITSPAAVNAAENQTGVIDVQSTDDADSEGSGLTYSLTGGADQTLFTIVPATGVITFNTAPDFEIPGDANADNDYEVDVTVTDSGLLTGVQNLVVTVTDVNESPTITSAATANAAENQTVAIDVQSIDDSDSEGAGLTYSLTGGADQALFTVDVNTGVISFLVAPDFEIPGDANADNDYEVDVTVTDSGLLTDVQNLVVTVTDVAENASPTITSPAAVNAAENQTGVIDVQSTDDADSEGSGLTYSLTGGADQTLFTIVPATGVITFNTAPDFEIPGDANADNDYEVDVTVTDSGLLTGVQNLVVTVTDVNESPTITSAATANAAENQTVAIDVQSIDDSDSEGAGLTYSLTGGADQALFTVDVNTGVISFLVAPDFEIPGDANADNDYEVDVTVTDSGLLTDVQNLVVTVTDVAENASPTITSPAAVNAAENQTGVIDVQSTDDADSEGSGLTYSLTGGADQTLFTIVPATGVITFNTAPDFEIPGDANADNDYEVDVTVTDSGLLTGVQNLVVTVTDVNESPTITSAATANAAENQTVAIDVQSIDDSDSEGAGLDL